MQKTILFLEDEQELLTTLGTLLRDQGYIVVDMITAEEALRKLASISPDLFLVDIKLPGIDGFYFFDEVRKIEKFKNTPCIFLTAFNNLQAAMYAKQRGAADYITKPFDFEYLITCIRNLLSAGNPSVPPA